MQRRHFLAAGAAVTAAGCAGIRDAAAAHPAAGVEDILGVERDFARTMAERDFAAFARFIDDEAQFLNGGRPLHGKAAILEFWKKQYEGDAAPFSWEPDQALILPSGTLAQTEGPVRDPAGTVFARFYSVWRRNRAGQWLIVFDNGYDICGQPAKVGG